MSQDIIPEILMLAFVLLVVGTCAGYSAGKADQIVNQKIIEAMEVRK